MPDSDDPCIHWWIVESPHDGKRLLDATCKRCGASRVYPASGDDERISWHPHVPGMQRAPITYIYEV
jgi:hypothetical protein